MPAPPPESEPAIVRAIRIVMQSLETLVRDLKLKRGRERRGLALAEGVRLVEEVLAAGVQVRAASVSPALEATPRGAALAASLRARAPKVESLGDRELAELAATEHPQGVIVVIEPKRFTLDDISLGKKGVVSCSMPSRIRATWER
jgi:TrmH family RNA methyltransferase